MFEYISDFRIIDWIDLGMLLLGVIALAVGPKSALERRRKYKLKQSEQPQNLDTD